MEVLEMESIKLYLKERKNELIERFNKINKGKTNFEEFSGKLFESLFEGNAYQFGNYYKKIDEVNKESQGIIAKIDEIDNLLLFEIPKIEKIQNTDF